MSKKFTLAGSAATERVDIARPTTLAEASAQMRAEWGDAWTDDRDPLPVCVVAWMADCWDLLKRGLLDRQTREVVIRAGIAVRNHGAPISAAQEDEIARRLARGAQLAETMASWRASDQERTGVLPTLEQACKQRARLARLVAIGLLPAPGTAIVREWLTGQTGERRGPIDHDARMRQAEGAFDTSGNSGAA